MNEFLPNSYLLGIHLTISTHSGQQIVYSYPPTTVDCVSSITNKSKTNKSISKRKDEAFKFQTQNDTDSSSSSSSSWSSGLSDSELSTDYADESLSSGSNEVVSSSSLSRERVNTDQLLEMFSSAQKNDIADDEDFQFNEVFFTKDNYQDIDKIFGINSEFVAEFCTPDRDLCNSRFEFTIDEFCFLGLPIHSDSNGKWRKSKHRRHTSKKSASLSHSNRKHSLAASSIHSSTSKLTDANSIHRKSTNASDITYTDGTMQSDSEDELNDLGKSMNMFHVCFILNPPLVEYNSRIDDMYQYVVAKLSLLLRYVQSKTQFVSNECSIILKEREYVIKHSEVYQSLKTPAEKGKYLYERILAKSCLARSLTECVDRLHENKIASIEIGEKMISLQIPIQNEFNVLPQYKIIDILPHSFLTSIVNKKFLERASMSYARDSRCGTSNVGMQFRNTDFNIMNKRNVEYSAQIDDEDDDILNYALLLLDDPTNILKNLESMTMVNSNSAGNGAGDVNSIILRHLIRLIQPNAPLMHYHSIITETLQIESSNISYDILRSCALHLIYWRHARVIIPISSKYTYVVSPLSALSDMYLEDAIKFREKFPSLPSLNYFLSNLSEPDTFEPTSQVNKVSNLSKALTRSKTFSGIRPFTSFIPSKEHKGIYLNALSWLIKYGYVYQLLTFVYIRVDKTIKMNVEEDLEKEGFRKFGKDQTVKGNRKNIKNLTFTSISNAIGSNDDRIGNISKNNNTTDAKGIDNLMADDLGDNILRERSVNNKEALHFEYDDPEMQQDFTIILEPERATALEKRWIYRCISEQPPDIQLLFKKLLKYFNGRTPLELVILKEGISRHEVKRLFFALDKYLVEVRHW